MIKCSDFYETQLKKSTHPVSRKSHFLRFDKTKKLLTAPSNFVHSQTQTTSRFTFDADASYAILCIWTEHTFQASLGCAAHDMLLGWRSIRRSGAVSAQDRGNFTTCNLITCKFAGKQCNMLSMMASWNKNSSECSHFMLSSRLSNDRFQTAHWWKSPGRTGMEKATAHRALYEGTSHPAELP